MMRPGQTLIAALGVALLSACPTKPTPVTSDEEPEVPYEGNAMSSVIPKLDPDADAGVFIIDAGMVVVETRCCVTNFAISDGEPSDATGVLLGQTSALRAGLPLTRTDAGWAASACMTLNASTLYWYRFTWDGGVFDAGEVDLPDGGLETVLEPITAIADRSSDQEPGVTDADGRKNYYRAVSSCDGLDGSVPR